MIRIIPFFGAFLSLLWLFFLKRIVQDFVRLFVFWLLGENNHALVTGIQIFLQVKCFTLHLCNLGWRNSHHRLIDCLITFISFIRIILVDHLNVQLLWDFTIVCSLVIRFWFFGLVDCIIWGGLVCFQWGLFVL